MSKQGVFEMRVGTDSSSLTEGTSHDAVDMRRLGKKQELKVRVQHHELIKLSHPLTKHSETSTPSPSWV
jgi:predicted amino acid-binding ACT domain protein